MIIISEFLLYLTLALVAGILIINLISKDKLPLIELKGKLASWLIILIPIFSFFPMLPLILGYGDDIGYLNAIKMILFQYTIGKAWFFNIGFTILLSFSYKFSTKKKLYSWISFLLYVAIIITLGASSHAAGLEGIKGILPHSIHLLTTTVWAGTLLVIGFFTKEFHNRDKFLKWFSPIAIGCLVLAILTGIHTMKININTYQEPPTPIINEYLNSWMVTFGEALLIKHLLIIPLIVFAFINRFIITKQKISNIMALNWVKAEGVVLLAIFLVTAFMGQQEPPHQVHGLLKVFGPALFFRTVYQGNIDPSMVVHFSFTFVSILLFILAIGFLALLILNAIKKRSAHLSFIFVFFFLISSYMGIILGVEIE